MIAALRTFADSNGGLALAVTLAVALALTACGPAAVTAPPSPSARAAPTRSPTPTLGAGMTRFTGTITDAADGYILSGVCVIIGPTAACGENMAHSDADGVWLADLPVGDGLSWTFTFVKDGYLNRIATATSDAPGEKRINITLQPK